MIVTRCGSINEINNEYERDFIYRNGEYNCGYLQTENFMKIVKALKKEYNNENYSENYEYLRSISQQTVLATCDRIGLYSDHLKAYHKKDLISDIFIHNDPYGIAFNSDCFI